MADPETNAAPAPSQEIIDELKSIVGDGGWIDDVSMMEPYLTEPRGHFVGKTPLILRPDNVENLAAAVKYCFETGTLIVPQGGNTGLCGGAIPHDTSNEIIISLSRLNSVRSIDPANNTITVEAGCILADIQAAADEEARLFPLSLAAEGSCQIGGNLSTNAGGTGVLRYGNARDLVLGLEVVLGDGRIWNGLRALRKDNTGYDLKQIFIGAEGTLGIITAAVLKLFPKPAEIKTAMAAVPNIENAVKLLSHFQSATADHLTAFELMRCDALDLVEEFVPGMVRPFKERHEWIILIDLSATTAEQGEPITAMMESTLHGAMESGLIVDAVVAASGAQAQAMWDIRENIPEAARLAASGIRHDVSVPITALDKFIAEAEAVVFGAIPGTRILAFGHLGDGNIHYNLIRPKNMESKEFLGFTEQINAAIHELVDRLGGSISAEHGLGQLKREEVRRFKSDVEMEMMETLKAAFDPKGILNPGKVL
jgi:FAD/FMN-containing dehydrogenase